MSAKKNDSFSFCFQFFFLLFSILKSFTKFFYLTLLSEPRTYSTMLNGIGDINIIFFFQIVEML